MSDTNTKKKLNIVHLYPEEMNIYGDMGNIITLQQRCLWRGIDVSVTILGMGNKSSDIDGDIFFMGGGQDNDMYKVFEDMLSNKRSFIQDQVDSSKVFLLICGGFQLFGDYFLDASGREIKGLGILPVITKAPGARLAQRCLGNMVSMLAPDLLLEISKYYSGEFSKFAVGFENHSGQTFFNSDSVKGLGQIQVGKGNNLNDKIEGARFRNIFATYSHGSLLPKNPHIADLLIGIALKNKYGKQGKLPELDDTVEWNAHYTMLSKLGIKGI